MQVIVFDFQPQDPENIFVALAALSGKAIPGKLYNYISVISVNYSHSLEFA